MRSLVREDGSRLVRFGRNGHEHAVSLARHTVRADVPFDTDPCRGLGLLLEDPVREPLAVEPGGHLRRLGKGHVDDVVGTPRVQVRALVVVDGVVRGSDQIRQPSGRAGIADGAERLGVGHRGERTKGSHRLAA